MGASFGGYADLLTVITSWAKDQDLGSQWLDSQLKISQISLVKGRGSGASEPAVGFWALFPVPFPLSFNSVNIYLEL